MQPNLISIDFLQYWKDFGYSNFGLCVTDHTEYFYVPIPKNASSYTTTSLVENNWSHDNYIHHDRLKTLTAIVILRDPIDRWISGINQYFVFNHPDIKFLSGDLLKVIFNKVVMDDHSEKQSYFCNGLDTSNTIFVRFEPNLQLFLNAFFQNKFKFHSQQINNNQSTIKQQLKKSLTDDIINKLKKFYDCDYKLFDKIKFIND